MKHRASRIVLAAVWLGAPAAALAQALDFTPDQERFLSDPNFLPAAGQIYGTSAYTHGWTDGNSANAAGLETSVFHVNTNALDQLLAFGITNDLTVDASLEYVPIDYRQIDYVTGRSQTLDSSGLSDPTFGATWRLLDENMSPVDVDLLGSYTPNVVNAHTASAVEDGTVARGGESGAAGAAVGYETRSLGIRGAFTANFYGNASSLNLTNGDTVQTQGYTNYTVSAATQARLNDLFSVDAGVGHTFASNVDAVNLTSGAPRSTEPGDETALQLALNYNFIPDRFVVSATYAHDFYDNARTSYDNPLLDTQTRDRSGNVVGVKLYYVAP